MAVSPPAPYPRLFILLLCLTVTPCPQAVPTLLVALSAPLIFLKRLGTGIWGQELGDVDLGTQIWAHGFGDNPSSLKGWLCLSMGITGQRQVTHVLKLLVALAFCHTPIVSLKELGARIWGQRFGDNP